jgi:hypothetical protein
MDDIMMNVILMKLYKQNIIYTMIIEFAVFCKLAVILFMNNFIELNEIHKRFPGQ